MAGWIAQDTKPVAPFVIRNRNFLSTTTNMYNSLHLAISYRNTNELPYAMLNTIKEMLQRQEEMVDANWSVKKDCFAISGSLRYCVYDFGSEGEPFVVADWYKFLGSNRMALLKYGTISSNLFISGDG